MLYFHDFSNDLREIHQNEQVNRPGSQHGFINFLVAPFVAASAACHESECPNGW
jgi:hypothetical protein